MSVAQLPPPEMTLDEARRLLARLALLCRATCDVPHAKAKHLRLVGFIVEPDEHYVRHEGIEMLAALQRLAGIDIKTLQLMLDERMNAPVKLPAKT
jgi:hypothetical protein